MPTIVHFDIAADDVARAKKFYETLFGWSMNSPGFPDYYLIETKDLNGDPGVGGGLGKRGDASQRITSYIGVEDLDAARAQVVELGGKAMPKMTVPGFGYLANCEDTEGNTFGLWQEDSSAAL